MQHTQLDTKAFVFRSWVDSWFNALSCKQTNKGKSASLPPSEWPVKLFYISRILHDFLKQYIVTDNTGFRHTTIVFKHITLKKWFKALYSLHFILYFIISCILYNVIPYLQRCGWKKVNFQQSFKHGLIYCKISWHGQ